MADQPLVLRGQQPVLSSRIVILIQRLIGPVRKHNRTAEALIRSIAGCIVQAGGIQLHTDACRQKECLHLRGVIGIPLFDILLLSQKQDQIVCRHIDL